MALDVQVIHGTPALVAARLCNFVTGLPGALMTHRDWLDRNVQPAILSSNAPWVDLIGYASRQWKYAGGSNPHELNRILSFNRCESVKDWVDNYSSKTRFNIELARGDSEALENPVADDGYDRAVEIYVYAAQPPPRPHPPAVSATTFEIRVVGGFSGSALAQADDYFFQIVDLTRRETAFYMYTGGGIGISIPKVPGAGSMTKAGPPAKFRTSRSAQLRQFNSRASLYQDAGFTFGSVSKGGTLRLSIKEITDSAGLIATIPSIIAIEGGWGVQMPGLGSASEGVLALVSAVFPFTSY